MFCKPLVYDRQIAVGLIPEREVRGVLEDHVLGTWYSLTSVSWSSGVASSKRPETTSVGARICLKRDSEDQSFVEPIT